MLVFLQHKKDGDIIVVAVGTANGGVLALDSTGVIWKSACHTGYVKPYYELGIVDFVTLITRLLLRCFYSSVM